MEHTVIHDEKVNRFEVLNRDRLLICNMRKRRGAGYTPYHGSSTIGRNGNSSRFDNGCCRYAEINQLKIKPTCSFAKTYFIRHSQYGDLLV